MVLATYQASVLQDSAHNGFCELGLAKVDDKPALTQRGPVSLAFRRGAVNLSTRPAAV